jgi:hypothetical protein
MGSAIRAPEPLGDMLNKTRDCRTDSGLKDGVE